MSNSLADLAAYPQLAGAARQISLGQQLIGAGAQGPTPLDAQSAASPIASGLQGVLGALLSGQGQQQVNTYAAQQQQALGAALQQQSDILSGRNTGDSSQGLTSGGGLQGGSSGAISTDSSAPNTPAGPAPANPMAAATPNGLGGYHIPGASQYALAVMQGESGGAPNATNPRSSATGPGQFTDATWNSFANAHPNLFAGLSTADTLAKRTDPAYAAAATDWLAGQNAQTLQSGGIAPTGPNLALAHRLGPAGAAAVIRAQPGTPVLTALSTTLPAADVKADGAANPTFAGMTVDDLRNSVARVPSYQVASADTGTATDALPSPLAPPGDTSAIAGGINRASPPAGPNAVTLGNMVANAGGGSPVAPPSPQAVLTGRMLSGTGGTSTPTGSPDASSRGLALYNLGQQNIISPNPRLQDLGRSELELGRTLLQRGQFQGVTLPNGVQAQRNAVTGEISPLPQRSVTTADGTVYDANTGQPIAGGVGAGGVRSQDVQGAALNTLAALAPRVSSGVATPGEHAAYASAAAAFQGTPQTYTKADGTVGTYVRPLPAGFPDPAGTAGAPGAGAPASAGASTPASGMTSGVGSLPGPTRASVELPQSQATATGTALANTVGTLRTAGQTAQRVVDQVGQIKSAVQAATANGLPAGYFSPELGEAAAAAKYLNIPIPGLQPGAVPNQQVAEATLKQFGGSVLKTMFPSRITNADLNIFLPSLGHLSQDPQAITKILDNAEQYARYDVDKSQAAERALAGNNGQLPPTWEANYNLIHGSAARLAPIPSPQQSAQLGWGQQGVPADVSTLNGFGTAPARNAPPVGTVASNPQSGEQQVMTKLGWRAYTPGQGLAD